MREVVAQLLRLVVADAALRLFALVYLDLEGQPESEHSGMGVGERRREHSPAAPAGIGAGPATIWPPGWKCGPLPWTTGWTARTGLVLSTSPPWPGNWPQGNAVGDAAGRGKVAEPSDVPGSHGRPESLPVLAGTNSSS